MGYTPGAGGDLPFVILIRHEGSSVAHESR